jgi:ABC-type nickel/cobalt efflux system permease component RcnA
MTPRRVVPILINLLVLLGLTSTVFAHPLNNFTVNHYTGLTLTRESVAIEYVLDMAEIPTIQEIATFDANGNNQPDPAETNPYREQQCQALSQQLAITANGQPLTLAVNASAIEFPVGSGGLLTLRLTCGFSAPLAAATDVVQIEVTNNAYADRLGWREIVVQAEAVVLEGNFATESVSQKLRVYPEDLLQTPLDQRTLSLKLLPPGVQPEASAPDQTVSTPSVFGPSQDDEFTKLITLQELTPWSILVALAVAFVWGAGHAMTPGHGKTIVGAYLVGSRGTAMHAIYLGLATTITHTAGVFALGLIALFASEYILPETLFPWLGLLSGVFVVVLGINMFVERFKGFLGRGGHSHGGAGHAHGGGHHHGGDPVHTHDHDHTHEPVPAAIPLAAPTLAVAGANSDGALAMYSENDHTYGEGGHHHGGDAHHYEHDHAHGDGGHHTHVVPGMDGQPVTWRSLLALGISGGLLPCPSALVVLLASIALGRVGLGVILVIVFSLGLASTLTGIGMLMVYARRLFEKVPLTGKLTYLVSAGSAAFITLAGLGIVYEALKQMGLVTL